jgi:hypothetical protein
VEVWTPGATPSAYDVREDGGAASGTATKLV